LSWQTKLGSASRDIEGVVHEKASSGRRNLCVVKNSGQCGYR
jgi:hypothetical protein